VHKRHQAAQRHLPQAAWYPLAILDINIVDESLVRGHHRHAISSDDSFAFRDHWRVKLALVPTSVPLTEGKRKMPGIAKHQFNLRQFRTGQIIPASCKLIFVHVYATVIRHREGLCHLGQKSSPAHHRVEQIPTGPVIGKLDEGVCTWRMQCQMPDVRPSAEQWFSAAAV
jgi:hypothetical protein